MASGKIICWFSHWLDWYCLRLSPRKQCTFADKKHNPFPDHGREHATVVHHRAVQGRAHHLHQGHLLVDMQSTRKCTTHTHPLYMLNTFLHMSHVKLMSSLSHVAVRYTHSLWRRIAFPAIRPRNAGPSRERGRSLGQTDKDEASLPHDQLTDQWVWDNMCGDVWGTSIYGCKFHV